MNEATIGDLELRRVSKRFGGFQAVDGVSLTIRKGEFLTLLGPSGSGKTTLLMMIAGFLDLTSGDIALADRSIASLPAEKRNFGMVFQGYALFPHMTVRQNIAYPLEIRKFPRAEIDARVGEMLALVQLKEFGHRKPDELSGGQKQRVALARALAFSPPVLLLDEPLGALDRKLRIKVQEQLKDIHRRVGTTFIFVTHDQEEALSMSDRIVIMRDGRVEQVGTPQELYERPSTRFAADFLGKSNFLYENGNLIALRPEKIDIAPEGQSAAPACRTGAVRTVTYFGSVLKCIVAVDGENDFEIDIDGWRKTFEPVAGQRVDLFWAHDATVRVEDR
ncbi:ABC transporter ATP-binding protein (plasmid) [Aminobacter sp. SR38]|jgi:putative spermidine/putrescine transport system ATP-binding protein|uniref:ABC transporter ATP-binding protein n=1 Tax=Aminobacter sp. SR38 TaxID=2774562 RepID=UPI001785E4AA|nr:ABC transporter ATP-binding protein [Aminobacter sp. SR38]QOF75072.1 ABC transporter ATP-binding protein [Aminobacter sp. SR38]